MFDFPSMPAGHRVQAKHADAVLLGDVVYDPVKSLWFTGMAMAALVGGGATFSWTAFGMFMGTTGFVLLLGHSLGSHRKLIHDSFQCPKWLEYFLVYCGVQVGLAGPLGLLRQHELRDYAQRLPYCHDYLRHGQSFWVDAWWQLHCELRLLDPPMIHLEPRIADDRFYRFLERTWMLQQVPPAMLLWALGGWGFVFWGVCARITAGVLGHWLIGFYAHNHGGMHHEVRGAAVQGRNIPLTSLLTMGECWHNNHHAFPGAARLGLYAGEWDPGWWVLSLWRRAGLVWAIRMPSDLRARPELLALDSVASEPADEAALTPARFGQIAALCLHGKQSLQQGKATLQGPAALVPMGWMRWLAGDQVEVRHLPHAPRLVLKLDQLVLAGWPALCVVIAARASLLRWLALGLSPVAVAAERIRGVMGAA